MWLSRAGIAALSLMVLTALIIVGQLPGRAANDALEAEIEATRAAAENQMVSLVNSFNAYAASATDELALSAEYESTRIQIEDARQSGQDQINALAEQDPNDPDVQRTARTALHDLTSAKSAALNTIKSAYQDARARISSGSTSTTTTSTTTTSTTTTSTTTTSTTASTTVPTSTTTTVPLTTTTSTAPGSTTSTSTVAPGSTTTTTAPGSAAGVTTTQPSRVTSTTVAPGGSADTGTAPTTTTTGPPSSSTTLPPASGGGGATPPPVGPIEAAIEASRQPVLQTVTTELAPAAEPDVASIPAIDMIVTFLRSAVLERLAIPSVGILMLLKAIALAFVSGVRSLLLPFGVLTLAVLVTQLFKRRSSPTPVPV